MVVVKIEMWPHGDASRARPLGEVRIANDGTGNAERGNYVAELAHAGAYYGKPGIWRKGRVCGHLRRMSLYRLVLRAIGASLGVRA